jgi:predicted permease
MTDLVFSLNAVAPLFLIMVLGFILRSRGFIGEVFVESGTRVCFFVALPCMLFLDTIQSDFKEAFDTPLILLCVCGTLVNVALLRLITPYFIKKTASRGAFIQASFRSNYALLGLPLVNNLTGAPGLTKAVAMLAFIVPLTNILAVLVLAEGQRQEGNRLLALSRHIFTNPLFVAVFLGVSGSFLSVRLPLLLESPLTYISNMAMPLALFTLGASIHLEKDIEKLRLALTASLLKLIAIPLTAIMVACRLGFAPAQIAVTLAVFAGPPAVVSFPMAFQMGADHQLASLTIVLATALSAVTMFSFVFVLRVTGWV